MITVHDSFIYKGINEQKLVNDLSGTGIVQYRKNNPYPLEYVNSSKPMGESFDKKLNAYVPTSKLCIVYSKKGTHIYPVNERSEIND